MVRIVAKCSTVPGKKVSEMFRVRVKLSEAELAREALAALEKRTGLAVKLSDWLRRAIKSQAESDLR